MMKGSAFEPEDQDVSAEDSAANTTPAFYAVSSDSAPSYINDTISMKKEDYEERTSFFCSVPLAKVQLSKPLPIKPATVDKTKQTPRKILCLYCDRTFVNINLRQKHIDRCHSAKQLRRVSLRRHQNSLTTTACFHCDKLTGTEHTLKDLFEHLIVNHSNKYHGCLLCEDRFLNGAQLADHNASTHRQDDQETMVKVTRSKVKLRNETEKVAIKGGRIGLKRSKRLQGKVVEPQKPKRRAKDGKKEKSPQLASAKIPPNSPPVVNPYPEFDSFFRVKKITDHSIDNLKINSLTFDDVFDKAFFTRIRCNIQENLLNHIDGKLFNNEESETRISNFEKCSNLPVELPHMSSENFGCELSLNALTPTTSLLSSSQFGEDLESQIEYGSKPSKKKTQTKRDEVHYKYFTRRKYQASILEHKENRDLSKLDMWTQYIIKNRQQKILDDKKTSEEILHYFSGEEYKDKIRRQELNRILDRRGPFEDLREEVTKKAALDKLNSGTNLQMSEDSFSQVRELLNDMLNRVFEAMDEVAPPNPEQDRTIVQKEGNVAEIPSYLNLRRASSLNSDGEIDKSDMIALICSSQETENFELPTNTVRGKNEKVELTGEWARSKIYVCAACGLKLQNIKQFLEHKSLYHQNVWVQHYEFVGNQSELYRHLSIPGLGKVGNLENNVMSKLWRRSEARLCTKCGKSCNSLGELHRHILECGGDWTWMLARKKCKYRPFGAKSRRKRRGLVKRLYPQKSEPTEKKLYKKTLDGPRQKPSDADTIQRMLANLPPKRITRKIMSLKDGFNNRRNNNQKTVKSPKMKCGKNIRHRKLSEDGKKANNDKSDYRRSLRNLNKILASRILDTNSSLMVKRKYKKRLNDKLKATNNSDKAEEMSKLSAEQVELINNCIESVVRNCDNETIQSDDLKPKRSSPRIGKKLAFNNTQSNNSKSIVEKMNIKRFFPVKKKQKSDSATTTNKVVDKVEAKIDKSSKNSQTNVEKNKRTFKSLVRNLSMRKRKDPPTVEHVKVDEEVANKKRKSRNSALDEVNVPEEKPKTDGSELAGDFLEENAGKNSPDLLKTEKIVIPLVVAEKNQVIAPIVVNCTSDRNITGTVFDLQTKNEKILQAKGEDDAHLDENGKSVPVELKKKKIRKPSRGLNDCIAMLTNKLCKKVLPRDEKTEMQGCSILKVPLFNEHFHLKPTTDDDTSHVNNKFDDDDDDDEEMLPNAKDPATDIANDSVILPKKINTPPRLNDTTLTESNAEVMEFQVPEQTANDDRNDECSLTLPGAIKDIVESDDELPLAVLCKSNKQFVSTNSEPVPETEIDQDAVCTNDSSFIANCEDKQLKDSEICEEMPVLTDDRATEVDDTLPAIVDNEKIVDEEEIVVSKADQVEILEMKTDTESKVNVDFELENSTEFLSQDSIVDNKEVLPMKSDEISSIFPEQIIESQPPILQKEVTATEVKEDSYPPEICEKKIVRTAKAKALEIILDDALSEVTESERNRETGKNSMTKRPKRMKKSITTNENKLLSNEELTSEIVTEAVSNKLELKSNTQEEKISEDSVNKTLRRSRRSSRKVTSYNEVDLDSSIYENCYKNSTEPVFGDPVIPPVKVNGEKCPSNDTTVGKNEKKLTSDELFDLLKATPNENIVLSKPTNSFFSTFDDELSEDFNDDNFEVFENILEKSIAVIEENLSSEKSVINLSSNEVTSNLYENNLNLTVPPMKQQKNRKTRNKHFTNRKSKRRQLGEQIENNLFENLFIQDSNNLDVDNSSSQSLSQKNKKTIVSDNKTNYCDICCKSFSRAESLTKHKRTLTHISKLSELEAKEAAAKLDNNDQVTDSASSSKNDLNLLNMLQAIERNDCKQFASPFTVNVESSSLKLADIISDVLNKPTTDDPHNFSDIILQNSSEIEPKFRRYRSLGERKSFEEENVSPTSQKTVNNSYFEPGISKSAGTILEKQISLLQNMIENGGSALSYVDEVSTSSTSQLAVDNNSVEEAVAVAITPPPVVVENSSKSNLDEESFLKPTQYEEISQDSNHHQQVKNCNFVDQQQHKSRKVLNRDEELFLECCSLLKSSSELSSYSKKSKLPLELNSYDEPDWFENKSLCRQVISENSTPLGDHFLNDDSNSKNVSLNWKINQESVSKSNSFSFEEVFTIEKNNASFNLNPQQQPQPRKNRVASDELSSSSTLNSYSCLDLGKSDDVSDASTTDSKKILTKGAMKVFEGLKVSIPTEDLNLTKLLTNTTTTETHHHNDRKKVLTKTRKKNKCKSRKDSTTVSKQTNMRMTSKAHDVYDFEETQDNSDVFQKPDFKTFRHKIEETKKQTESDNDSRNCLDRVSNAEVFSSSTSSISDSTSKQVNLQENITKKKCMIMGRIFKNAAKSRIEDNMRNTPTLDNVRDFVIESECDQNIEAIKPIAVEEINDKPLDNMPDETGKSEEHKLASIRRKSKTKNRKRNRTGPDSSDDEFNLGKFSRKRCSKKGSKLEDNSINLEQELKECIGVASRKSQRKCTSGKQNVLVEYWSSDESSVEELVESQVFQQPTVIQHTATFEKVELAKKKVEVENKNSVKLSERIDDGLVIAEPVKMKLPSEQAANRRKRSAASPLYHWSSSSEDETYDLIEIKPIRDEIEYDDDRPIQHGWIVGDSPKKLVTMLAQAKGKKCDTDAVKEQGGKRRNNSFR